MPDAVVEAAGIRDKELQRRAVPSRSHNSSNSSKSSLTGTLPVGKVSHRFGRNTQAPVAGQPSASFVREYYG
jgi:hypothetical protein